MARRPQSSLLLAWCVPRCKKLVSSSLLPREMADVNSALLQAEKETTRSMRWCLGNNTKKHKSVFSRSPARWKDHRLRDCCCVNKGHSSAWYFWRKAARIAYECVPSKGASCPEPVCYANLLSIKRKSK